MTTYTPDGNAPVAASDADGDTPILFQKINGTDRTFPYALAAGNGTLTINGDRTLVYDDTGDVSGHPTAGNTAQLVQFTATVTDGTDESAPATITINIEGAVDAVAPVLTSPTAAADGQTGATGLGVTTDEGNGTLYWGVYPTASTPTAADVVAGTGATVNGSQAVSTTGAQAVADQTGLTAGTAYKAHYVQDDAAANRSALSTSAEFTTTSASAGLNATALTYGSNGSAQTALYRGTGPVFATNPQAFVLAGVLRTTDLATSAQVLLGAMGSQGSAGFGYITAVGGIEMMRGVQLADGTLYTQAALATAITVNEWYQFIMCWDSRTAGLQAEKSRHRSLAGGNLTWVSDSDPLTGVADKAIDFTDVGAIATATTYTFGNRDDGSDNRGIRGQFSFGIWAGSVDLATAGLHTAAFNDNGTWNPDAISTALGSDPGFFTPGTVADADAGLHQGTADGGSFDLSFRTGNAS